MVRLTAMVIGVLIGAGAAGFAFGAELSIAAA